MTHPLVVIDARQKTYLRYQGRELTHGFVMEDDQVTREKVETMRVYPNSLATETEEVA